MPSGPRHRTARARGGEPGSRTLGGQEKLRKQGRRSLTFFREIDSLEKRIGAYVNERAAAGRLRLEIKGSQEARGTGAAYRGQVSINAFHTSTSNLTQRVPPTYTSCKKYDLVFNPGFQTIAALLRFNRQKEAFTGYSGSIYKSQFSVNV